MSAAKARGPEDSSAQQPGPDSEVSDEALMERVAQDDREALQGLMNRYWDALLSYAANMLGDRDASEDIVQNTFVLVWERRGRWTTTGSVSAYLYRTTRNLSLNAGRDRLLRQQRHAESADQGMETLRARTPHEKLEEGALRAEIEAAISRLSDRRREVLILSRFHGLSHRQIAETLGTSRRTVANQMTEALEELRNVLAHHLGDG